MNSHTAPQLPHIPKWPFILADSILVLFAIYTVIGSQKPMNGWVLLLCILSVTLGILLFSAPYLLDHFTQQQTLKTKQAKTGETVIESLDIADNLLNRFETIHAELMKSILAVRQVPIKIEEKVEEIIQLLERNENKELEVLKTEIQSLKNFDRESLDQTIQDYRASVEKLESLTKTIPEPSSTGLDISNEIKDSITSVINAVNDNKKNDTADLVESVDLITKMIADLQSQLKLQIDTLELKLNSPNHPPSNITKNEAEIETIEPAQESIESNKNQIDEVETNTIDDNSTEDTFHETTKSTKIDSDSNDLGLDLDNTLNNSTTPINEDGSTRLLVNAFIGISNKLYIRGSGPGLDWDKGVPLELVGIGKWEWKSSKADSPVSCRILINDEEWTDQEELVIQPGTTIETNASI